MTALDASTSSGQKAALAPASFRYRPALDGIRALAVLAVLVSHSWGQVARGGWLGVDVFFVLSGYLITALLTVEWQLTGHIRLRTFYLRRALRLLPALSATIALSLLVAFIEWPLSAADTAREAIGAMGYIANWLIVVGVVHSGLLVHTWSLAIEEQFYWVWPIALFAALRLGGRRVALTVALVGALLSTGDHLLFSNGAYFRTDARAGALLLGCVAALAESLGYLRIVPRRAWNVVGILSAMALVVGALVVQEDRAIGLSLTWIDFAAMVLVLAVTQHESGRIALILSTGSLVWVGQRSYGIYLYAAPAAALIQPFAGGDGWLPLLVGCLMAVGMATASYRYLEQPFLRLKRKAAPAGALPSALPADHP
jgi:peptidoglycan/LPS O-acetylase OafA/YrhL